MSADGRPRRATYRVQLNRRFSFDEVAELSGYFHDLGISHIYCSPILQSVPGSQHGYDVVDHNRINEDLGGLAGHERMVKALTAHGLGNIVDLVPNHMAVAGRANGWWWDVLENGPASLYASYFDIDWDPPESKLRATVLVPMLGDHYGRVLEAGQLVVTRDGGSFIVRYFDNELPVSPRTIDDLLSEAADACESDELASIATAMSRLPHAEETDRDSVLERHRDKEVLRARLEQLCDTYPDAAYAVDAAVDRLNRDYDGLDGLLARQNYRLAFWRTAGRELDYRRFFDISSLVAMRMEEEHVFEDTHALLLGLVRDGAVDGLRIDHPDGLRDPEQYLERLADRTGGAYVIVEKILEPHEKLPARWPVAGTTGYDFLNEVSGLFVDANSEQTLTDLYERFTGSSEDFAEVAWHATHQILREVLASDIERLTAKFVDVCEDHRRYRDYTRADLRDVLREVLAALRVYRTYVRAAVGPTVTAEDQVQEAIALAARRRPDLDGELLSFLADLLLLRHTAPAAVELCERFQQVSAAVTAKGVEDTAFYRFNRLVSLNEVGGDPARFATSVEDFHEHNLRILRDWPETMLALSTHDSKRSADVRARIHLLSEIPTEWEAAVWRWAHVNERHRRGGLPDRNAEYLLYQTLVGAWPLSPDRAVAYMEKAAKEAKVHTSWTDPVAEYDHALRRFVEAALADPTFVADVQGFVDGLVDAGRVNSLAQTVLALTSPGVPDIYQGHELWDLSLVDPDNRRPVDFALRRRMLAELEDARGSDVWARADEGAPKLWLISKVLDVRRRRPECFAPGATYEPLSVSGPQSHHAVGYRRGGDVLVVAPRLVLGLRLEGGWGATSLELPEGEWVDELSDEPVGGRSVGLAELFESFPVAVLARA